MVRWPECLTTPPKNSSQEEIVSRSKKSAKGVARGKANGAVDTAGKPKAKPAPAVSSESSSEEESVSEDESEEDSEAESEEESDSEEDSEPAKKPTVVRKGGTGGLSIDGVGLVEIMIFFSVPWFLVIPGLDRETAHHFSGVDLVSIGEFCQEI